MRIRFQADADLNQIIVAAVLRRLPEADFRSATDAGLAGLHDLDVLAHDRHGHLPPDGHTGTLERGHGPFFEEEQVSRDRRVERDVTAVYDRHSYDPEKRTALEAWGSRLEAIVSEDRRQAVVGLQPRERARLRKVQRYNRVQRTAP